MRIIGSRPMVLVLTLAILSGLFWVTHNQGDVVTPAIAGKARDSSEVQPGNNTQGLAEEDDRPVKGDDWVKELPEGWSLSKDAPTHPMAPTEDALRLSLAPPRIWKAA